MIIDLGPLQSGPRHRLHVAAHSSRSPALNRSQGPSLKRYLSQKRTLLFRMYGISKDKKKEPDDELK